ncbi:alpha/beta hydrolase, partial [Aldersonia kunmingensis]|uniref:alpha/beta hydrolase n=1 Tax=Aldersonia kunmingensis TaxID=408066 RepID=UPI003CCBFA94
MTLILAGSTAAVSAQPTGSVPVPEVTSEDGSKIVSIKEVKPQNLTVTVHSAAMDRNVPLTVLRPADTSTPAPTLYLLNGAGGGEDAASWAVKTDYVDFFRDKHVNVVTPLAGRFSYYTDWLKPDEKLGTNKWQTFLTKELPPLIDAAFDTNHVNSIAGISTSGTSVFNLAIAAPGLYKGIGAYSGCAETSQPLGQRYVEITVNVWGGGDVENMWGKPEDPLWAANDPYLNAAKLRGMAIYVSNGTGIPGPHDTLSDPLIHGQTGTLVNQMLVGGVIEATTNQCT